MFVDEPGSPTQTTAGLLHPRHRQRGHNADSGELLRCPETVPRAGGGDRQPQSVQGARAVVTLDDVAGSVERRRGQGRFDIFLDDLCTGFLKTCVGIGQQSFKQGRRVSGDQFALKSLVLPRFDIASQLREVRSGVGIAACVIGVGQGCVPALCRVWAAASSLSGERRCSEA